MKHHRYSFPLEGEGWDGDGVLALRRLSIHAGSGSASPSGTPMSNTFKVMETIV